MADAVSIGGITFDLIFKLLGGVGIIAFALILWFGIQAYKKRSKKQKQFKQTAIIISRNATVSLDKLAFLKSVDGMLHMAFKKRAQDKLPPIPYKYLRNNQCILFNYAPGQYAPIDPTTWEVVDLSSFGIKLLNNNMKNFAMLEQRAATHRWAMRQDKLKQLTPWITLGIVAVAACIISWFVLKTASSMFTQGSAARFAECKTVMSVQNPSVPAAVASSVPVGVSS